MSETATGILIFVKVLHQQPLVKKVFLLQNFKRYHRCLFSSLLDYLYATVLNEINQTASRLKDLLSSEYFLIIQVCISPTHCYLDYQIDKERLLLSRN